MGLTGFSDIVFNQVESALDLWLKAQEELLSLMEGDLHTYTKEEQEKVLTEYVEQIDQCLCSLNYVSVLRLPLDKKRLQCFVSRLESLQNKVKGHVDVEDEEDMWI